ncbi:MAG: YidH family protein [Candidatus Methylumidiphilus sp.]
MSDLNDPRVLFAAERTLLAWNRTCLALMAFGFMIERFGLFIQILAPNHRAQPMDAMSAWLGLAFIALGGALSVLSTIQHRRVLKTLKPSEIPSGYWTALPMATNLLLTLMSLGLSAYLLHSVFGP